MHSRAPELESEDPTLQVSGIRMASTDDTQPMRRPDANDAHDGAALPPSTAAPTPQETLSAGERERSRSFLQIVTVLSAIALFGTWQIEAPLSHRVFVVVSVALAILASTWMLVQLRDPIAHTPGRTLAVGYAWMLAAFSGIVFFGALSPAVVVVPLGLYFISLNHRARTVYLTALIYSAGYALIAVLTHAEWIEEGIISTAHVAPRDKAIGLLLVIAALFATAMAARAGRAASLRAVERHDRLVRELAQREVMLAGHRSRLDEACATGGVGRFTDEVLGSYRLGAVIGQGAMGEVYEAVGTDLPEAAAVKVLKPELLSDPSQVRRFIREAHLCRDLEMPHVVRVFQVGGIEAATPYIAMERLRGRDLKAHLAERHLMIAEVVKLAREVGRALDAASGAGIVHRDIKPTNLFLTDVDGGEPIWKVLDFGIAKLTSTRGTLTQGRIVGTPAYMAPEQANGVVTHRSDLYSLGVICYCALTGHKPFSGETFADSIYRVVATMPPRPSDVAPDLPPAFDAVLAVAMAKDPMRRFASAHELADAIEKAAVDELDPLVATRAASVLRQHPWGESCTPEPSRTGAPRPSHRAADWT